MPGAAPRAARLYSAASWWCVQNAAVCNCHCLRISRRMLRRSKLIAWTLQSSSSVPNPSNLSLPNSTLLLVVLSLTACSDSLRCHSLCSGSLRCYSLRALAQLLYDHHPEPSHSLCCQHCCAGTLSRALLTVLLVAVVTQLVTCPAYDATTALRTAGAVWRRSHAAWRAGRTLPVHSTDPTSANTQ